MSKYKYGFQEWSRDVRFYSVECDKKLTRDEVYDAIYEVVGDCQEYGDRHKVPLDNGSIAVVTYNGNEVGSSNRGWNRFTEGEEDLLDE